MLSVPSLLAVLVLAVLPARATTYTDAIGDSDGAAETDISSVVVTNDANNLTFAINLNTSATISQYPNYLIGIQVVGGPIGQTNINNLSSGVTAGNPWGKTVGISSGENFFIGVYPNGPSWSGGAQVFQYTNNQAGGWSSQIGNTIPIAETASGTPSITFSVPLSALGLSAGNSFNFDVWSTYGAPGGQGAYDALDNPNYPLGYPWDGAIYDSATAPGSVLANYTVMAASGYQVWITFQVDMTNAIIMGAFNPPPGGIDNVSAQGSFNEWSTSQPMGVSLTNVPGTSVYSATFTTNNLTLGNVFQYKYVIDGQEGGGNWEGNVGPGGNRSFTLSVTNQVLPLVYWDNITTLVTNAVTFQVDMTVETALGIFNPGNGDSVGVAGDWNWDGTSSQQLTETGDTHVYTGTVDIANTPGQVINYKYVIDGGIFSSLPNSGWENPNVGPGGISDRQFVFPNEATNLPMDSFNNLTDLGPLYISGSGAQTIVSWPYGTNAGNTIRLQSSTTMLSGWAEVPNTQGQSSVTNNPSTGTMFFRLIWP